MINSRHKKLFILRKKTYGAITLIFTIILLVLSTLIILFAGNYVFFQDKMTANLMRTHQAFETAEAGLEYGIVYLQQNRALIIANPTNGFINSPTNNNITNVVLPNGSKYSIVYSNPTANNFNVIQITSTGTSDDGLATHVSSQQVYFGSLLINAPTLPVTSKGAVTMGGNSKVTDASGANTIKSGSTVTMNGSSQTTSQSGGSSAGHIGADISQNDPTLSSQTASDFFETYFGLPANEIKASIAHVYNNATSTNYSSTLAGMSGTSIWIDQTGGTATLNGNTVIGSATNPVLLIVNGALDISGNVQIFGYVYVSGPASQVTDITGNLNITGGLINGDILNMSGNVSINYDPTVIANMQSQQSYFAKIAGSWKDF